MLTKRDLKTPDYESAVPDEQTIVYRTCAICRQSMPLDHFERRGRPRKDGSPPKSDDVCKHCREIQEKETRKFVRQNAKKIDGMMLDLVGAMADDPMTEFDDLPNIGTAVQYLLRPFGGMQGLALQIASSYLSSPPGSTCRQKTHSLLMNMAKEASKLGYAKKPMELMSDAELEEFLREKQRRLMKLADDDEEIQNEAVVAD